MGLTETALGIIPGAGGTQRLPRLMGLAKAKELIYTTRRLSAEEAYQYGIIEHIAEPGKLLEQARELAYEMPKMHRFHSYRQKRRSIRGCRQIFLPV